MRGLPARLFSLTIRADSRNTCIRAVPTAICGWESSFMHA